MLMTSAIPNLVNGVSQQPFNLRLSSQAEAQKNMLSSVVDGLSHRPGTRNIAKISGEEDLFTDAFIHIINRDREERYVVVVQDGGLRVFDLASGEEQIVNFPDGTDYLNNAAPPDGFRAVTVADYTMIVNRGVTTQMEDEPSPQPQNAALVYIRGGNYGRKYSIKVNNVEVTHETPSGSNATDHPPLIDTAVIAQELADKLSASFSFSTFSISRVRDVIMISRSTDTAFSVGAGDGAGNTNVSVFYKTTQRFSELPDVAFDGFFLEIAGDNNNGFGNYYVRFASDAGGDMGSGVWRESLKGGEKFRFDASTLPHALRREADGTFTFAPIEWKEREVGDLESIPEPSFINRPINDVYFYRNRLGFIADENVIMSRNAEFFDLWRQTATTLTDGDPIDVAVTHTRVSILNHAVPFNESLLLFSDQTQFVLDSGDILTPTTVSIQQATEYESNSTTRPVGVGPFIYFPVDRGSYTGIREFYVDGQSASKSANDVTSHCPRYIPSGVFKMAATTSEDLMVVLSRKERNKLWPYRYYTNNQEKLQSSWSVWEFSDNAHILNAEFIESQLILVMAYSGEGGGVYLETIDLESGATDENAPFLARMDRKVYEDELEMEFDGTYTTVTLPYAETGDLWFVTRPPPDGHPGTGYPGGVVLNYDRVSPSKVRIPGDWTSVTIVAGRRIRSEYEFSTLTLRTGDADGGGQSSIGEGRLQILFLAIEYSRTGYFEVHVKGAGRPTTVRQFSGNLLGSEQTVVGEQGLQTGRFKVPIFSRNTQVSIKIVTDSFVPAYFMSAEWEGRYTARARRM